LVPAEVPLEAPLEAVGLLDDVLHADATRATTATIASALGFIWPILHSISK
jgi:hypothetical protein